MRVLLEGVEMTVSIAAKNFREKVRKSIMPLSVVLLVLSTVITVLLAAIVMMPDLTGNEMKSSSGILKCAALAIFAVFLIVMGFYIYNVVIPMITIEKKLFAAQDDGGRERLRKKNESTFVRKPFFNVYTELMSLIDDNATKADREYSLAMLKKQAEIKALQNQINPHFLYNTLDCIRGMAIEQGADNIEEMTRALSGMFRYSISRKGKTKALMEEELANVNNYLRIQQYRFRNKINITETIDPAAKKCCVPKLLIQPIVENAVFYGLEPKTGERNLNIEAYCTGKKLIVKVEDNGVGMSFDKLRTINDAMCSGVSMGDNGRGTQLGIVNVNERLRLLYGEEFGLRIFSCPKVGTTIEMVLPIIIEEV
ncbi:MAG: sensor histidine kinase [Christensenellales bacterium]|jgi:signal transduction histidine kinase, lytS